MTHLNPIHFNDAERQAHETSKTTEAVKVLCETLCDKMDEVRGAVKEISVTKEIQIDFTETNDLLKKLVEKDNEPVEVTVELNLT